MAAGARLENANPLIYGRSSERPLTAREQEEEAVDIIDNREIFDIRGRAEPGRRDGERVSINDPEHPLSLEELNVVEQLRVN
eukprot:g38193.t1